MSQYRPGDTVYAEFITSSSTGAATNADSLPTGTVNKNGTDDGAVTVTVTNIDAGRYKATYPIPATYQVGDVCILTVSATVSSVVGKAMISNVKLGGDAVVRFGTAQAGNANSIQLDSGASATNQLYKGMLVLTIGGTGANQCRAIKSYNGTTKNAVVDYQWVTNPDNTTVFAVLAADNPALNSNLQTSSAPTSIAIRSGTAQAGGANTITLDASASATNNIYNNDLVAITGGTGLGQTQTIISYNGTTKVATIGKTWTTTPDNTSTFSIYASTDPSQFSDQGVAQAGGASTITLAATSSTTNSIYNGSLITILAGTGAGQTQTVNSYVGATHVATMDAAWGTPPDSTSVYAVIPAANVTAPVSFPTAAQILNTILTTDLSTITGEASRSVLNAIRLLRNKWTVAAGTLTVYKEDDSTSAWTGAVTTDGAAQPITGNDPA